MSPALTAPPFPRGKTFFDGQTVDSTNVPKWVGKSFWFEDTVRGKGNFVRYRVVKNNSGFALLPGRLAQLSGAGGIANVTEATGYARLTAVANALPIDDQLPSAGVPDGDYFYVIDGGTCLARTALSLAATITADNADSAWLVAITGATSGATTSGRVHPADFTGATALLADQILNVVGRALSAATTNNTDTLILVEVRSRW